LVKQRLIPSIRWNDCVDAQAKTEDRGPALAVWRASLPLHRPGGERNSGAVIARQQAVDCFQAMACPGSIS
jgi:hypothetical protein